MFLGTGPDSSITGMASSTSALCHTAVSQTAPQEGLHISMGQGLFLTQSLHVAVMFQSLKGVNGHRTFCVCGLRAQKWSQALLIY